MSIITPLTAPQILQQGSFEIPTFKQKLEKRKEVLIDSVIIFFEQLFTRGIMSGFSPVSNSLADKAHKPTKIQAFSLAVARMLHSYWLTQSLLLQNILDDSRQFQFHNMMQSNQTWCKSDVQFLPRLIGICFESKLINILACFVKNIVFIKTKLSRI